MAPVTAVAMGSGRFRFAFCWSAVARSKLMPSSPRHKRRSRFQPAIAERYGKSVGSDRRSSVSPHNEAFCVGAFENKSHSGPGPVRLQFAMVVRRNEPLKEHRFNTGMVMKVFDVAKVPNRAPDVHVKRRRAVGRNRTAETCRNRRTFQKPCDSLASGRIQLQDV